MSIFLSVTWLDGTRWFLMFHSAHEATERESLNNRRAICCMDLMRSFRDNICFRVFRFWGSVAYSGYIQNAFGCQSLVRFFSWLCAQTNLEIPGHPTWALDLGELYYVAKSVVPLHTLCLVLTHEQTERRVRIQTSILKLQPCRHTRLPLSCSWRWLLSTWTMIHLL